MASVSEGESLEESIRSIAGKHAAELEGRGMPNGSPAALMICAAAMSCVHMIKKLPRLNKACIFRNCARPVIFQHAK